MNEEHSRPFTYVLLSLLLPLTASSPCFLSNLHPRTHTATHKCTHTHKHRTRSSYKAGLYSLGRFSALYVFAPVCVCMCVQAGISSLKRVTNHKHTSLSFSIFFSSSLSLYFFHLLSAADHERQAQPFLQIPALASLKRLMINTVNTMQCMFAIIYFELTVQPNFLSLRCISCTVVFYLTIKRSV